MIVGRKTVCLKTYSVLYGVTQSAHRGCIVLGVKSVHEWMSIKFYGSF
jgi:hypothetical protein